MYDSKSTFCYVGYQANHISSGQIIKALVALTAAAQAVPIAAPEPNLAA